MIDLHSHALPSIDDGAKNVETSVKMLSESRKQGVEICVLTPHCVLHDGESLEKFFKKRNESFSLLKEAISANPSAFPALRLGAEVYFDNDISQYEGIEKLCIEGTNLLLVEFPMRAINKNSYDWLYSLTLRGIKPVIAHVDRYQFYNDLINDFSDLGVVYQLNAENFLSFFGRRIISKILKNGEEFIVSSDMHNLTDRPCNMKEAFTIAQKKMGTLKARKLFQRNAATQIKLEI